MLFLVVVSSSLLLTNQPSYIFIHYLYYFYLLLIITGSVLPEIRGNCIVALGDLAFRFPNLIEPWTAHLYALLRDPVPRVRKNAVMVLTHLILNDMIKVKGQISEMAVRLEDPVPRIAALARLFFHELGQKQNTIYNILPDVISALADSTSSGVTSEQFCSIMKYLFGFVKRERQVESLVEKLCHRFRTTLEVSQWRLFAFCLHLLPLHERAIRRLGEQMPCYQDKLGDAEVHGYICDALKRAGKFARPEARETITELEGRVAEHHEKFAADAATADKAAAAGRRAKRRGGGGATIKGSKKKDANNEEEEEEEEGGMSSADEEVTIASDEEDLNKSTGSEEEERGDENKAPNKGRGRRGKKVAATSAAKNKPVKTKATTGRRGRRGRVQSESADELMI